jgi:hypothetical protein
MLVACRLAGLCALEGHYADDNAQAQSGVEAVLARLRAMRGPGESYSDVILRLVGIKGACAP